MSRLRELQQRDSKYIWHPFTQMQLEPYAIPIERGEGALLYDPEGREYIDAISSWWVNTHGHANPRIADAIAKQAQKLEQVIFAGFTHEPAVELAEKLLGILPANQERIFFSDDGSTSVEVALKLAIQYWHNRKENRRKIIAFEDAYHGDTFGAMSVTARDTFTLPFHDYLFEVSRIPVPVSGCEEQAKEALKGELQSGGVAALIIEPLILGAGGMIMYSPEVLETLVSLAHEYGALVIADEVMTGFGRTGKNFAFDHIESNPDLICLSKGLTGGFLPLGVTACTAEIFEAFLSDDKKEMFTHGHSFTANPLSCAAAVESVTILAEDKTQAAIKRISGLNREFVEELKSLKGVNNPRCRGTVLALEIEADDDSSYFGAFRDRLYRYFIENRVILRPLGNTVYIIPPYCITGEQLKRVYEVIVAAVEGGDVRVV